MKFFADENFPGAAIRILRQNGFDVAWAAEQSRGASDEEILSVCAERVLLTLDKDFGELVFRNKLSTRSSVILFRIDARSPEEFAAISLTALQTGHDWSGYFSVVHKDRIRMRRIQQESRLNRT
jgi:predicted nuclease of predicted toxin-antitoxin system